MLKKHLKTSLPLGKLSKCGMLSIKLSYPSTSSGTALRQVQD